MSAINMNEWKRKEVFEFFSGISNPYYMVSFRQDVTNLYKFSKENHISFYYCLCFLCVKALNQIEAFHYTIREGNVYYLENRNPSFTDMKKNSELFHIVTMSLTEDIKEFVKEAKKKSESQTTFIDMEKETDDLVYISCLPWMDITGITNERELNDKDDSIPRVSWGKYVRVNDTLELGISIEVNHRLIDGNHLGMFAQNLTQLINAL